MNWTDLATAAAIAGGIWLVVYAAFEEATKARERFLGDVRKVVREELDRHE